MRGVRRRSAASWVVGMTATLALGLLAAPAAAAPSGSAVDAAQSPVSMAMTPGSAAAPISAIEPTDYAAAPAEPDWLKAVNIYRAATGLAPVTNNAAWSASIAAHLKYTLLNGLMGHGEDPGKPYYTAAGAEAGMSSNLAWSGAPLSAVDDIAGWMTAPYHGVGILRSALTTVAFASYDVKKGYLRHAAGLDVIRGIDWSVPEATGPVLFPGPGLTVPTGAFAGNETPDPLAHCTSLKYGASAGLPIIVMLPEAPPAGITATIVGAKGVVVAASAKKTICTVVKDGMDNAVFLLPKNDLANGSYKITVNIPGQKPLQWAFGVDSKRAMPVLGCTGIPDVTASNKLCADIRWLLDAKITSLALDGGFHPSDAVPKASVATFLYRGMHPGKKAPACKTKPYKDVATTYQLCGEVAWLKSLGVPLTFADGTFRSGTAMDRATLAQLMFRLGNPGKGAPGCKARPFKDIAVSNPACGAIAYAKAQKLIPAPADGTFKPASPVQRQNLATLLRFAVAHR